MPYLFTPLHVLIFLLEMVWPAIVARNMATRRGANVLLWAVVGFLTGWIGVLILLAVGGSPAQQCPGCKMFAPNGATICGHCRTALGAPS